MALRCILLLTTIIASAQPLLAADKKTILVGDSIVGTVYLNEQEIRVSDIAYADKPLPAADIENKSIATIAVDLTQAHGPGLLAYVGPNPRFLYWVFTDAMIHISLPLSDDKALSKIRIAPQSSKQSVNYLKKLIRHNTKAIQ